MDSLREARRSNEKRTEHLGQSLQDVSGVSKLSVVPHKTYYRVFEVSKAQSKKAEQYKELVRYQLKLCVRGVCCVSQCVCGVWCVCVCVCVCVCGVCGVYVFVYGLFTKHYVYLWYFLFSSLSLPACLSSTQNGGNVFKDSLHVHNAALKQRLH